MASALSAHHTTPTRYLSQRSRAAYALVAVQRYKLLFGDGMDWLLAHIPDDFDSRSTSAFELLMDLRQEAGTRGELSEAGA